MIFSVNNVALCSCKSEENRLLWKISGKDLKQASYLFGTWHGTSDVCIDILDSIQGVSCNSDVECIFIQYRGEMNHKKPKNENGTFTEYLVCDDYRVADISVNKHSVLSQEIFITSGDLVSFTIDTMKMFPKNSINRQKRIL